MRVQDTYEKMYEGDDAYSGQIAIEVTADSKTVPLQYKDLLKNYLDLKHKMEKDGDGE